MTAPEGIVVLGVPRSGTTLLRRILDAHPRIACPPETYLLRGAARFLHEDRFASGPRIGTLVGLSYAGFPEGEVLSRLRELVFGFARDHAARHGKARWAHKTAFDAFHVPAIRKLVGGHVRFVCVQRHGLDVVASLEDLVQKTGGYVEELHAYLRRHPAPLEAFAHAWVDSASEIARLAAEDERAITVRYEELVRDPEGATRALLSALNEPWDDGLLSRALGEAHEVGFGDWKTYGRAAIDGASVGRWRALPGTVLPRLAEICNPTLRALGYDAVETRRERDDDDDEAARRRYELGLLVNRMRARDAKDDR